VTYQLLARREHIKAIVQARQIQPVLDSIEFLAIARTLDGQTVPIRVGVCQRNGRGAINTAAAAVVTTADVTGVGTDTAVIIYSRSSRLCRLFASRLWSDQARARHIVAVIGEYGCCRLME
jgi:hypothetical protein